MILLFPFSFKTSVVYQIKLLNSLSSSIPLPHTVDQSDVTFLADKLGGQLNFDQKEAVQMALKQPFTVIQGPPGSGKTLTAAHLACLFVERNRMTPQSASQDMARTQVLICASSDTAVDAVAGGFEKERENLFCSCVVVYMWCPFC